MSVVTIGLVYLCVVRLVVSGNENGLGLLNTLMAL
jgi:hypothetical protein